VGRRAFFLHYINLLNRYVVGVNKQDEKNIVFTRIPSESDSTIIITYYPKSNHQYSNKRIYKSGRFIIDTKTWTILRFDWTIDNKTVAYQNSFVEKGKREEKWHEVFCSFFFSANGIPSRVEQKIVYSLKDTPDKVYTWTTSHLYEIFTQSEFLQKPSSKYDQSKFIFSQNPLMMPDFESKFVVD